ncbi:MAG: MerR family transcriptional regulator [Pseudomonadota bacterium]|nr:MAG: MerR family transcriptional regulator [Pseudomonadota bacterium]
MASDRLPEITAVLVSDEVRYRLDELCQLCNVRTELVVELVEHGLLEPSGESRESWTFAADAVPLIRMAGRLQRDLEINLAGVTIVMDLLQELEELRGRVRALEHQLSELE